MKTLIAYATKRGATRDMAARIAGGLGGADIVDLDGPEAGRVDLSAYGTVVIGASTYAGSLRKSAVTWAKAREAELASKKVALFEIGSAKDALAVETALPGLCAVAVAVAKLGGEIRWKRLSLPERWIIKAIMKTEGDSSTIDDDAVEAFVEAVRKASL
ncbi:MAG TPA: flavodoxin domain-containing protein [Spirochaetales bacterium]|nr:flavodoxin domain-containing protein [Spirochaetales bacterium]HPG87054.1 flavodoxin domain-containing protein [Spirochaetales bacterium]HPM73965.1 flavodoxin domain-containing protein [Spirochaetales bacterium]